MVKLKKNQEEAVTLITLTTMINAHLISLTEFVGDCGEHLPVSKITLENLSKVFMEEMKAVSDSCVENG